MPGASSSAQHPSTGDAPFSTPSVRGQRWHLPPVDERLTLALQQKHHLPDSIARILAQRGVTLEHAEDFLHPTLKRLLPDPLHLLDMEKAATRLSHAIQHGENTVVFGDYDVDGATSSALLIRFCRAAGLVITAYIPDRLTEGYGPNTEALLRLHEQGAALIITVDCGAVAHEPIAAATEAGVDTIVIDHHLGAEQLPNAVAVVNPNRVDETTEHRQLAAVGVAFLLIVATNALLREAGWYKDRPEPNPLEWLDCVALGTICDVVPLTGVNRAFVRQGLKVMAQRGNLGLATLADIARFDEPPNTYACGFILGPRINAGGRVGQSHLGTTLLTTSDSEEASTIATELDRYNKERKAIEEQVLEEAFAEAERRAENSSILLIAGEGWHPGVIGIVASRIKERYHKPTAIIALENGIGKASARSISGVDLGAAITAARQSDLLIAGGGHAMAAGFTVTEENIPALHDFLEVCLAATVAERTATRQLNLDGILSPSAITLELAQNLEQLGPFGASNPTPRFALTQVHIADCRIVGENHLRCILRDTTAGGNTTARLKAMAFRALDTPLGNALLHHKNAPLHVAGTVRFNRWNGSETAEFTIEDVII